MDPWIEAPPGPRRAVESALQPGERVVTWLLTDLDADRRYHQGVVALTGSRLLSAASDESGIGSWELGPGTDLRVDEMGVIATLDLLGPEGRLGRWRFTASKVAAAHRLVEQFHARRGIPVEQEAERPADEFVCPICSGVIPAEGADCPTCAERQPPASKSMLRLLRFAWPWRWLALLGFLLTLASTAAALVPIYLTMPLLDRVLIPYQAGDAVDKSLVLWYLAGLFGAALLAWVLSWGRTYVLAWVSERVSAELRNRTYEHLQRLSLSFFGAKRTGDLISRVSSDSDRICYFLSVHLIDFASDVLMIGLTAVVLVSIDPLLALFTLAPVPVIAWLAQWARERLRTSFAGESRAWGAMTSVLADTIPGIRVVKAFAQERREVELFRQANNQVLAANDRVNRMWSFFGPVVVLLTDIGLLIVWAFGAWSIFQGRITVGILSLFTGAIGRFYARLDSMSRMLAAVQRAAASAHRVFEIMDVVPDVPEPARPVRQPRVEGEIEFRNVRFRYGNREVVRGVNLKIRPGEMVGLVGPSGAGKSTLVNLACRFYDVTDGAILVDGVDVRSLAVEDFRRNIGLVLQEPFLFFGSIAENIAYGKPDATREEIIAAARAARAHDFILRLPDGYDSMVGERGQGLSGGERQRISIARALLIDPAILILDEATSSVDTETEREIQLALENLIQGRTTIAIAHRLSTLHRADRLVVLEDGRITEIGPHQELIKLPGTYRRLHQAQLELAQGQAG